MDMPAQDTAATAGVVATIAGAALWLRRWLSTDRLARTQDSASIAATSEWKIIAAREYEARIAAEARADRFAAERNEMVREIGELKAQIAALTEQSRHLAEQVTHLEEKMIGDRDAAPQRPRRT